MDPILPARSPTENRSRARRERSVGSIVAVAGSCIFSMIAILSCAHVPPAAGPGLRAEAIPLATGSWGGFRTLRGEQRVTVEVGRERHRLRGVIAVERPDRFRLRALGPAGVTLFDLLYVGGHSEVIDALRDPRGEKLRALLGDVAGDLAATFDLLPRPAGRRVARAAGGLDVEEPGRRIRLRDFRALGRKAVPRRIEIENLARGYRVLVEGGDTTLDQPLDPALFRPKL